MTNYTTQPGMVRADFHKSSGKWYMTEAINMEPYYDDLDIHKAVEKALADLRPDRPADWYKDFHVVVQEPYHRNAYPIMLTAEGTPR